MLIKFRVWQGNNFEDETKPALWYWQWVDAPFNTAIGGEASTEDDAVLLAKYSRKNNNYTFRRVKPCP